MELVELQSIWEGVVEDTTSMPGIDEYVTEKTIHNNSESVLGKIKRIMKIKFVFGGITILLCVLLLLGSFIDPDQYRILENLLSIEENRIFLSSAMVIHCLYDSMELRRL